MVPSLRLEARASADAARDVADVWSGLRVEQVFRTDMVAMAGGAAGLARDFVLGGLLGRTVTTGCLDTSPLDALLERVFPPRGIAEAIRAGRATATPESASTRSKSFYAVTTTKSLRPEPSRVSRVRSDRPRACRR